MGAKAVVLALALLAATAAVDAVRQRPASALPPPPVSGDDRAPAAAGLELVAGKSEGIRAAGPYLRKRVVRGGRTYVGEAAIARAFPLPVAGPFDIAHVAVAPDGTLVLAVYGFSPRGRTRAAIELWEGREPAGAFAVPPGSFGGGLAFSRDGALIATFRRDGTLAGLFDRRGLDRGGR